MMEFRRAGLVGVCCAVVGLTGLYGCGSDDGDTAASSDKAADGPMTQAEVKQVTDVVTQHLKRPTSIGISGPPVKVAPDKTVYFIAKAIPVTQQMVKQSEQAVKMLGWKFKNLAISSNPQAFQTGMRKALDDPETDAIMMSAAPVPVVAKHLAEAKAKNIPVVIVQADEEPKNGNFVAVGGPASYRLQGQLLADYVLSKTRGREQAMFINPSAIPSLTLTKDAFVEEWKQKCPKCTDPVVYDAPLEALGKSLPSLVVAKLQANRDVKWLVGSTNTLLIGLPDALKAAGLTGVQGTMWAQGPETNGLIGNFVSANLTMPVQEIGWAAVDAVVRTFAGESVAQNEAFPDRSQAWFLTKPAMEKNGLDPAKEWPIIPGYVDQFKKQWGLSQ